MTCIVAVTDGQTVVIGGDSAASGEQEIHLRADEKVFRSGHYVVGFTRSYRMGQVLRYSTSLPEPPGNPDVAELERFMVVEFVEALRHSFRDAGYLKTSTITRSGNYSEAGQEVGGVFLVGVAGHIFEIRHDFQVGRPARPYSAVGYGAPYAFGALHALQREASYSLRDWARAALEAAEESSTVVRGPFRFVELEAAIEIASE